MSHIIRNIVAKQSLKDRPNILLVPFNGMFEQDLAKHLPNYNFLILREMSLLPLGNQILPNCTTLRPSDNHLTIDLIINSNPFIADKVNKLASGIHTNVLNLFHFPNQEESDSAAVMSKNFGGSLNYFFEKQPRKEPDKTKVIVREIPHSNIMGIILNELKGYKVTVFKPGLKIDGHSLFIDLSNDEFFPHYPIFFSALNIPSVCTHTTARDGMLTSGTKFIDNIRLIKTEVDQILSRQEVYNTLLEGCETLNENYTMENIKDWDMIIQEHCNRIYQR
jgi:hypothetical protein